MKKLIFPEKINLEKQVLSGLSKKDFQKMLRYLLPGLAILLFFWATTKDPARQILFVFLALGYAGACDAVFIKIDGSISIYEYLSRIHKFYRSQKKYLYKQQEELIYDYETEIR